MIIKNKWPIVGWIFMAIWFVFLCLMTWIFIRDQGFHQFDVQWEITIIVGFWFFGFAAAAYFFGQPLTFLNISANKIEIVETWLLKKEIHQLQKSEIKDIYIKTHLDSDGDSFELILQTYKKDFSIQQSSDLQKIETLKQKLSSIF